MILNWFAKLLDVKEDSAAETAFVAYYIGAIRRESTGDERAEILSQLKYKARVLGGQEPTTSTYDSSLV